MNLITCAFCKGTGKDPFNLLSSFATCQVCGGRGDVGITEPAIECAYCKGTGVYPYGSRITCTVCGGKGMVLAGK
jgi:DnaJ-class molecular chaperone